MEKRFVNYLPVAGKKGKKYYDAIETGLSIFVKSSLYENIKDTESKPANVDIEASYLCHGIWTKIMVNKYNYGKPQSGNSFYWCKNEADNTILFHFDIMNNPKKKSCGLANECSEEKREAKRKEWENIYHTVGNMTPIPWIKVKGGHYIDGQQLHKSLDERWDLYLRFLQLTWQEFDIDNIMSFKEYMILTCQQMYFKDIYEDMMENTINEENISKWNKEICKDSELISFSELDAAEDTIINLIKLRCEVIRVMLTKKDS